MSSNKFDKKAVVKVSIFAGFIVLAVTLVRFKDYFFGTGLGIYLASSFCLKRGGLLLKILGVEQKI